MIDMNWAQDRMNGVSLKAASKAGDASRIGKQKLRKRTRLLVLAFVVGTLCAMWGISTKKLSPGTGQ